MIKLSDGQKQLANYPLNNKVFLSGVAGSGKTTVAIGYLQNLLNEGVPGNEILILVPQRSLGLVYQETIETIPFINGGFPTIQTMGGIAQRMIRLFWPVVASQANFKNPGLPPNFLTLETAQYYLTKVCQPFFEKNYFQDIRAEKPRILSQILDNLNKAAVVGFSHLEISEKLKSAWDQLPGHIHAYDEAQECANAFRDFCLQHNLLDFSLQFSIFANYLWKSAICREFLFDQYSVLIYDNCEEDVPVSHDIILDWLPRIDRGIINKDEEAGFRTFLGADPTSADRISKICDKRFQINENWISSPEIEKLKSIFRISLSKERFDDSISEPFNAVTFHHSNYYPKMMDLISEQIDRLIQQGVTPGNIAILAPFVSDALRFQIQYRLNKKNIQLISHRPSRSLREETITNVLLTWAKIAHPQWGLIPSSYEVRIALNRSLTGLDPIRADLLIRVLYQPKNENWLGDFHDIRADMRERITEQVSEQFNALQNWLQSYRQSPSDLDIFLARLFGEVLSQPGFGLYENFAAANVTAKLIESIHKFRRTVQSAIALNSEDFAKEYISMVENGVIAALYLENWESPPSDSVYLAPAYTFLMQNRSVDIQIWIDIGSMGWWQRLMQPLTQPYVLSRNWTMGQKWTDIDEFNTNQSNLLKLSLGLLRRTRKKIILHTTGYNESGNEERGPLLQAVQKILRHYNRPKEQSNV